MLCAGCKLPEKKASDSLAWRCYHANPSRKEGLTAGIKEDWGGGDVSRFARPSIEELKGMPSKSAVTRQSSARYLSFALQSRQGASSREPAG